jgi:Ala-tRNA(Pro) deacylase
MHLDPFLHLYDIAPQRHDHAAVMTCAESDLLVPKLPGCKAKNLFLQAKKSQRHLLVTVASDRSVDLARLGEVLGVGRLGFASAARLASHLGVTPGAVSLLALLNDTAHAVEFVIDRSLWEADAVQAHPLVNTATALVMHADLVVFLAASGHAARVIDVPVKTPEEVAS